MWMTLSAEAMNKAQLIKLVTAAHNFDVHAQRNMLT